jgi:hypothetical protein
MSSSRTLKLLAAMLVLSTLLIATPALAQNKQVDAAISEVVIGNSQFACCAPELVPLRNPDFRPTDS